MRSNECTHSIQSVDENDPNAGFLLGDGNDADIGNSQCSIVSSSEDGQTAKLRKSALPLHKHEHGSAHDQRPHHHNFMLNMSKLFPLEELEDEECEDATHGAGDEEEGV